MTNAYPLVSVVMACYNNGKYVTQALNSVRDQTYQNTELIIVDDASTDNSVEVISNWIKTYERPVNLIIHKENQGICNTFSDLVKNATGKYISLIAADDVYLSDKIASQVELLEKCSTNVAMVYSDVYLIDEEGKKQFGTYMLSKCNTRFEEAPSGSILKNLEQENFLHFLSVLIRREVYNDIGLYDENLKFEDYDMAIRIAKKYEVKFIDNIQAEYRIHTQSFSGKTRGWHNLLLPLYLKHADLPLFKQKAADIILNDYVHNISGADQNADAYFTKTGEKIKYHFFISNNIPPFFMKIYRKLGG